MSERAEKRKQTIHAYDTEAAYLLDQFYLRLRKWCMAKGTVASFIPTWWDIQAARVLVRMKLYSRSEILQRMDKYFEYLDDLLAERAAHPTFTHFLNNTRKIL